MLAVASLFFSALRPQIETLQPADASACAMPRPMPPLPPVMTATRPVRSNRVMWFPWAFPSCVETLAALGGGQVGCVTSMDKAVQKIKYASRSKPIVPQDEISGTTTQEETMQFTHVTLDFEGSVAVLKLDHQDVMNAVSLDMLGGLGEALDAIDDRKAEVRCLVITGAGRAFCTGANLQGRNNQKPGRSNAGAAL